VADAGEGDLDLFMAPLTEETPQAPEERVWSVAELNRFLYEPYSIARNMCR
jgi:hypothetical protein